jgi:hypothetical protein
MKQTNMNRRDFVERLLVLPVGAFLLRCGSSTTSTYSTTGGGGGTTGGGDAPGAPPELSGTEAVYTSSNVDAHTHTFGIELQDFLVPPDSGVTGLTSEDAQHTHSVTVPNAVLARVQSGDSVKVVTSSDLGHTHVFTFVRVGPPPSTTG